MPYVIRRSKVIQQTKTKRYFCYTPLCFLFLQKFRMEDFYGKLLAFPKWHDKEFTEELLRNHLIECLELLNTGNDHLNAELIDLIQITQIYLRQNLDASQIQKLTQERYDKFMQKLALDKK